MSHSLLSNSALRALLFIGCVSYVVRWLETLAIALFAYRLTESAFVVAMLSMLRMLPMGLFGAFIGAAAERIGLRRVLQWVVGVSLASSVALALLAQLGMLQIWHLVVASFANGVCLATDNPVRRMMIGNAVGPERMGSAISVDVAISNASRVMGPVLAGMLLARHDIVSVFLLGSLLHAGSLLVSLRLPRESVTVARAQATFLRGMLEGLAWLRSDRRMVGVLVVTIIFNIFAWPYTSLIPVIATEFYRLDPRGVGLIASCEGIGGLLGAVVLSRLARPRWYGRIYVGAVFFYFSTMLVFAMTPYAPAAGAVLLLNGMGAVGFAVMQATLVYRGAPADMRGRLMGVLSVCIGTSPIGFVYLGFLADALTPRVATLAMAGQGLLVMWILRRHWLPALRPVAG